MLDLNRVTCTYFMFANEKKLLVPEMIIAILERANRNIDIQRK